MTDEKCYCKKNIEIEKKITGPSPVNIPVSVVIFGATGDLTKRKLIPAFFDIFKEKILSSYFLITGFARREKSNEEFRMEAKDMAKKILSNKFKENLWKDFSEKIFYHQSNFNDLEGYEKLRLFLEKKDKESNINSNKLFYLACAPDYFPLIVENLSRKGLLNDINSWSRVVIEKPFGRDLNSAKELKEKLSNYLREEQLYLIDHYLGKETVQNILSFRFGNAIFEPLFSNKYIDHIQITVSESLGMEGRRGGYYDKSGALRDIVQNHLLQLLSLVAMEPPFSFEARAIQDEKVKIFKSIRPFTECCIRNNVIRGQYGKGTINGEAVKSYREEKGVDPDSNRETYVAMEIHIDNWRWAGVPFYIRTGKRLKRKLTEIAVQFKTPPLRFFNTVECEGDICDIIRQEPNSIIFQVQPDEGISLTFSAKRPGPDFLVQPVKMNFGYKETFEKRLIDAYERLLLDVIKGDMTLFPLFKEIEVCWEVVDPVLKYWKENPENIFFYNSGSDGPKESKKLFTSCEGRWRSI